MNTPLRPGEAADLVVELRGLNRYYAMTLLRRAADTGEVETCRTVGGHRRYDRGSVLRWVGEPDDDRSVEFVGPSAAAKILGVEHWSVTGRFASLLSVLTGSGLVAVDDSGRANAADLEAVASAVSEGRRLPMQDSPAVGRYLDELRNEMGVPA